MWCKFGCLQEASNELFQSVSNYSRLVQCKILHNSLQFTSPLYCLLTVKHTQHKLMINFLQICCHWMPTPGCVTDGHDINGKWDRNSVFLSQEPNIMESKSNMQTCGKWGIYSKISFKVLLTKKFVVWIWNLPISRVSLLFFPSLLCHRYQSKICK